MWSLAVSEVAAGNNLDAHGTLYVAPAMEADFSVGLDADVNLWKIRNDRSLRMAAEETLLMATEESGQCGAGTVRTTMLHSEDTEIYLGSLGKF